MTSFLRGSARRGSPEARARQSAGQRGANNPAWKGGRHIDRHGYVWLRIASDDAIGMAMLSSRTRQYVQEHRLVMARALGRPLVKGEAVHHVNGKRDDNRLENLKLFASNADHLRHLHLETCPNCGYALRQSA